MNAGAKATRPPVRGLMLDSARLTERHEFYFDLLLQLKRWGINTLWWHFADDEGFALKLRSHGELATPYAFTRTELGRFVRAARALGIDVVPEVETLGHTRYITSLRRYSHLADGGAGLYNAACPSHPDTLKLMSEIIEEVAGLFDSEYFHAGLDEVNLGDCRRCARRGRGRPGWWVYAQHVRAIHDIVTRCGKRMIMWADHVEQAPAMLKVLPKDIILAHWQYGQVRRGQIVASLKAGFSVICAPALCRSGDVIQPNAAGFDNIDQMVRTASSLAGRGVLGVVNTWWTPWRFVRDAAMPAVAYTGRILKTGRPAAKIAFFRSFVRDYFGPDSTAAARALWSLHELMPRSWEFSAALVDSSERLRDAVSLARGAGFAARAKKIDRCVAVLADAGKGVRRHKAQYSAAVLAGRIAAACMATAKSWREVDKLLRRGEAASGRGRAPAKPAEQLAAAAERLVEARRRLDEIYSLACREWDRTRYSRDAKKLFRPSAPIPWADDSLLGRLDRCRQYHRKVLNKLTRAVAACRRGGPLPGGVEKLLDVSDNPA